VGIPVARAQLARGVSQRLQPIAEFDLALPPVRYDSLCTIPFEVKPWLPLSSGLYFLLYIKSCRLQFCGHRAFSLSFYILDILLFPLVRLPPFSFVCYLGLGIGVPVFIKSLLVSPCDVTNLLAFLINPVCSSKILGFPS
jgi:hypothetical protein